MRKLLISLLALALFGVSLLTASTTQAAYRPPLRFATLYPSLTIGAHTYRGDAWQHLELAAYLDHWLATAQHAGLDAVRATDWLEHVASPYNTTVWANLDHLLAAAAYRHMRVVLDLSAYRNWLRVQGRTPYDPAQWTAFLRFVIGRYRGNPTVAYWSIAGEIPAPVWAGSPSAAQYVAFYAAVGQSIHAIDPTARISAGGMSYLDWPSGVPWQAIDALPDMQVAAIHVYSHGDETVTLPMVAAWAHVNGKPFVVEEFGFQQSLGDAVRAGAIRRVIGAATANGAAGWGVWNLGPEDKAQSYDIGPLTPAALLALSA